jgi:hypothetical protein
MNSRISRYSWGIVVTMIMMVCPGRVWAQVSAGADLAIESRYIWRGIPFNTDPVFWPDAWVSWQGFTASVYGAQEMTDIYQRSGKFTEVDLYLEYARTVGPVDAKVGYGHYIYPNTAPPGGEDLPATGELYVGAGHVLGQTTASICGYYDVKEAKGLYITPCLSSSWSYRAITPSLTLSIGYADKKHNLFYFGQDRAGLTDFTGRFELAVTPPGKLGEYVTFTGDLNYSSILDKELRKSWVDHEDNFWWGLGVHFNYEWGMTNQE